MLFDLARLEGVQRHCGLVSRDENAVRAGNRVEDAQLYRTYGWDWSTALRHRAAVLNREPWLSLDEGDVNSHSEVAYARCNEEASWARALYVRSAEEGWESSLFRFGRRIILD